MVTTMPRTTDSPERQAVIITGGGTGIGRATAQMFAAEGVGVLIVGRSAECLAETAKGWPTIRTLTADITDPQAPEAIVSAAIAAFGHIDVLVNNAGIIRAAPLVEIDREEAYRQVETNLMAPLFLTQAAVPHIRPGGMVINISSNPASRGWPNNSVYGSTKVGLDFLTRTWALELAPRGIRVISIAPGVTDTPVLLHANLTPEQIAAKRKRNRIPLSRIAQPEEIGWWIVTATRPEASYITGAVIRVDGGASIG
jgi:nogalaviketone/aklaviketone reductase